MWHFTHRAPSLGSPSGVGKVALQAEAIAFLVEFGAVHVMAVVATHTVRVHLALHERAPNVDLFEYLPVRVVEPIREQ
jgi:hypothetical protein